MPAADKEDRARSRSRNRDRDRDAKKKTEKKTEYSVDDEVQFYSQSYETWIDTTVTQVKNGEIEVECKKGHWLRDSEISKKLRKAPAGSGAGAGAGGKGRPSGMDRALETPAMKGAGKSNYSGKGMAGRPSAMGGKGAARPEPRPLDRSKTCPFLLRVFHKIGGHHSLDVFQERGKEPVDDELQVYTWPDVTLKELADLVKDVAPEARGNSARLNFRLIYPDKQGKNVMTELGTVTNLKRGPDDNKRFSASKFQTGDLLDLAIFV